MYICIARIRKTHLTHCQRNANNRQTGGFSESVESSKLFWSNSWITQTVRQWIPDCRTSRSEGTATEGAAADTWNSQLMAAGGSQVPATGTQSMRYIGAWFRRQRWTVTASLYCTRWGMFSQCSSSWAWVFDCRGWRKLGVADYMMKPRCWRYAWDAVRSGKNPLADVTSWENNNFDWIGVYIGYAKQLLVTFRKRRNVETYSYTKCTTTKH